MCIHISGFHSITSVLLDKLYQGSMNFSEQKFRFPWHKMKFTINWLFCSYRSNQQIVNCFAQPLVILVNRHTKKLKKWEKTRTTQQKTRSTCLFLQTGNLPSSSCVSIRIFNLTSQIDIEWCRLCCFMGYLEIAS